ncbi:MAG TPA: hypothetical protein V6D15_15950 [Oculatellaceae cyanobacterium]|jgi:hypothetical protein
MNCSTISITSNLINIINLPEEQQHIASYRVNQVLHPILQSSPTDPFRKGTLVTNKKYFGIVSKVKPNSDTPIKISWWEPGSEKVSEQLWYSWELLRVLKIEPLPLLVPQKTFLIIPERTLVVTDNGDLIQFTTTGFWLKSIDESGYHLLNQNEYWLFPHLNFPGIPFACVNTLPSRAAIEAAQRLNYFQLKIKADLWLTSNNFGQILEQVHSHIISETCLKSALIKSEHLLGEDWILTDLQIAWQAAFSSYLDEQKRLFGLWGFKVGARVVCSTTKYQFNSSSPCGYDYQFGTVTALELDADKPVVIRWELTECTTSYDQQELDNNSINIVNQIVKLSDYVSYEVSTDGKLYRAIIGIKAKNIANYWRRYLQKELGLLSQLLPNYHAAVEYLGSSMKHKYFYLAEQPRQKTFKARLRHLEKVASWDLGKRFS